MNGCFEEEKEGNEDEQTIKRRHMGSLFTGRCFFGRLVCGIDYFGYFGTIDVFFGEQSTSIVPEKDTVAAAEAVTTAAYMEQTASILA